MGDLVNGVLARVLEEIEDQDDISEEDSKRLNRLCKMLHGLDALFVDGESVRFGHPESQIAGPTDSHRPPSRFTSRSGSSLSSYPSSSRRPWCAAPCGLD